MKDFIKKFLDIRGEVGGHTGFTTSAGLATIAVASTAVVYTKAINISKSIYFGLHVKALSAAGTPSLQIDFEQSSVAPSVEGSADANFVIPDGASAIYANLNDEVWHVKQISPVPMTYIRLKITGLAGNEADTILQAKLFTQSIN